MDKDYGVEKGEGGGRGDWKGDEQHPKTRALYFLCDELPFLTLAFYYSSTPATWGPELEMWCQTKLTAVA